jgi:hypothetical protein
MLLNGGPERGVYSHVINEGVEDGFDRGQRRRLG